MGERAKISVQGYSWDRSIQNLVNIWQEEIEQKSMIDEQEFLVNPEYN